MKLRVKWARELDALGKWAGKYCHTCRCGWLAFSLVSDLVCIVAFTIQITASAILLFKGCVANLLSFCSPQCGNIGKSAANASSRRLEAAA